MSIVGKKDNAGSCVQMFSPCAHEWTITVKRRSLRPCSRAKAFASLAKEQTQQGLPAALPQGDLSQEIERDVFRSAKYQYALA